MKKIAIITPVPDVVKTLIENSIIRKSIDNEVAQIEVINLRDHGVGNYRQVDDSPFGGGGGMVSELYIDTSGGTSGSTRGVTSGIISGSITGVTSRITSGVTRGIISGATSGVTSGINNGLKSGKKNGITNRNKN